MRHYEILPHTADVRVHVRASTRAGLVAAALQGMVEASGPRYVQEDAPETERPFSIEAADFEQLLVDVLNAAILASGTHHEAYGDVRFTLITDKKAQGAFIGSPVKGFETEIKAATHHELKVAKNEAGEWETTVVFDA